MIKRGSIQTPEEALDRDLCGGEVNILKAAGITLSGTKPRAQTATAKEAIVYLRLNGRAAFAKEYHPAPLPQQEQEEMRVSGRLSRPSETGCNHSSPRQGHGHY